MKIKFLGTAFLTLILLTVSACGSGRNEAIAEPTYEHEPQEIITTTYEYEPQEIINFEVEIPVDESITVVDEEDIEEDFDEGGFDEEDLDEEYAELPPYPQSMELPEGYVRSGGMITRTVRYDTGLTFAAEGVSVNTISSPQYFSLGSKWLNTEQGSFLMPVQNINNSIFSQSESVAWPYLAVGFYCTITGEERIPAIFEYASEFSYGFAQVRYDGLYGFIDTAGEWVIPPIYDWRHIGSSFRDGREGLLRIQCPETRLWGIIGTDGQYVFPPIYNSISEFNDFGKAVARLGNQNFLINLHAEKIVEFNIDDMNFNMNYYIGDGLLMVSSRHTNHQNRLRGVVTLSGTEVIPIAYNDIRRISDTRFLLQIGAGARAGEHEIIDITTGERVNINNNTRPVSRLNLRFDGDFSSGVAVVSRRAVNYRATGIYGLTNVYGEFIIPFGRYTGMRYFGDGLIGVRVGDGPQWCRDARWGFVDSTGREIVPPIYRIALSVDRGGTHEVIVPFDPPSGVASIQCPDTFLWGIVDNTGQEVFAPIFMSIRYFRGDFAVGNIGGTEFLNGKGGSLLVGGTWHVFNRAGEIIASFEYATLAQITENLFVFADSVTEGIMDSDLSAFEQEGQVAAFPSAFGIISITQ